MAEKGKINVLLATGLFPPDIGGPATFVKNLAEEFPKYGCDIKVLTYGDETEFPNYKFQFPDKSQIQNSKRSTSTQQIFKVWRKQNIIFRYFKYFLQVWQLAKWADIVYTFDLISAGLPCALAKFFNPRIKLIVRLGGDYQWEVALQKGRYDNILEKYYSEKKFSIYERLVYFLNNFVLEKADRIIFNAEILKDIYTRLRGVRPDKTEVIKNIVKAPLPQRPGPEKDYVNILYIGRIVAFKNLLRLIKVFSAIENSRRKNIVLEIVGEGPEKARLVEYVNANKLKNRVKILPKLNHTEALEKIFNCDIFATVSLTEINAHTVSEAMAFGKPILLTDKSESFFVGDRSPNITYVDPTDENEISMKLNTMIDKIFTHSNHHGFASDQNETGRIAYNPGQIIKAHLNLFHKILRGSQEQI